MSGYSYQVFNAISDGDTHTKMENIEYSTNPRNLITPFNMMYHYFKMLRNGLDIDGEPLEVEHVY